MAATDQHLRSQKTLDVVFGVSCGLMLLTTVWMFADDYNRSFKSVQRTFRDVEATVAERDLVDKLPDPALLQQRRVLLKRAREGVEDAKAATVLTVEEVETNRKLARSPDTRDTGEAVKARSELNKAVAEFGAVERRLKAKLDSADEAYRTIKADLDSKVSFYNIEIDDAGKYPKDSPSAAAHRKKAEALDAEVRKLESELASAKVVLDEIDLEIKSKIRAPLEGAEKQVAAAEEEMKKLAGVSDRFAKFAAQKAWTTADTFRALPILDGFESPIKIRQLWLPDLTIDYGGFRDVPRYDRCTTCHLGIEKGTYDKETLARLGDAKESSRLTAKLVTAKDELEKRVRAGENLGFSPADLPGERQGRLGLISLLLAACVVVAAVSLGVLQQSPRLGMVTMFAGLALTLLTSGALAWFSPRVTTVKTIKLEPSQISQYAGHPRLDLFVDSNSPHGMEKFGCTICHSGQGSATDFNYATHTPNDAVQTEKWKKDHHYHPTHYWDFPMLSKRFVESSCLKCHHQVTDLVRAGGKEEAPKLLKGYNLVREMGCFGCHEIQGLKSGRPVGPDMRLESSPALDWLSPSEQERLKSDAANPPGTYRKVGPSLRRLSEKVNQDWTAQWIADPRGFRPDTKMPHFYNLSTNSKEFLAKDDPKQENFPAAEVHAISQYLIQESKNSLAGKDAYRVALLSGKKNLHMLQKELVKNGLGDKDQKELYDVSKRFSDLALLSAPRNGAAINSLSARQRSLQEKLAELHRRGAESDAVKTEVAAAGKELDEVTESLIAASKTTPLSKDNLVNEDGDKVALPEKDGDPTRGRELFTEKGCLACHAHEGTTKPLQKDGKTLIGAVVSEANFGPELSRIADKLSAESGRTWLVQWLMNPNVYHPRTRMPITHLKPADANDIAAWLLSQKTGWKGTKTDPADPSLDDYKKLARVYLGKAPGVTRLELNTFLPEEGADLPGIPAERMDAFARDADERVLAKGTVTPDKLKWYVGRKAIGRLGCYACHDIPGFETAKPIGVGLNDWGKKDGDKLAFEDAEAFVKSHFNIVPTRVTRAEVETRMKALEEKPEKERTDAEQKELDKLKKQVEDQKRIDELDQKAIEKGLTAKEQAELEKLKVLKFFEPVKNGSSHAKEPFEEFFFDALDHHQREGFLHLKLFEPRSYDYNRIKPWDDRLRMPQFKFARSRQKAGESNEAYAARQEKDEAEAREAVMTFILGLVAEPVPAKYLHNPGPEKKAEIAGRQVLDKFNCAGCHQIRPGVYDFKASDVQAMLDRSYNLAAGDNGRNLLKDHAFQGHNSWFGTNPTGDRLQAFGYRDAQVTAQAQDNPDLGGTVAVRLSDALRFAGSDRVMRDLPEGTYLYLPNGTFKEAEPYGGTFADVMVPYLAKKDSTKFPPADPGKARTVLPPPLLREGERIQPDWLYKFLLNPHPIRPMYPESTAGLLLRMPKFNLSPEDSRAVVNYFAAVSKTTNPGAGVTAPYTYIPQRDPEYWRHSIANYEQSVQRMLDSAKKEVAAAKGNAEKEKAWQARVKLIEDTLAQKDKAPKDAKVKDLYSRLAYNLLTHKDLCLKCHAMAHVKIDGAQGPNLALASERLRPEWVEQWVAQPERLFPYAPVMPQNFPNNPDPLQWTYQDTFAGTPLQQAKAARDLIMDLPRLTDLLTSNPPTVPPPASGEKK